ncbi:MAG TPA: iron-sulfur cluster repair di-iron protein [Vicinamibacterales bacterium]|nr:iron-sulfur cluster repair di-iron protein [Vicinamibacterales bacterium]
MSEVFERTTIGEIVAGDFRAAGVFERFGIDFCCGGRRTISEACRTAAADPSAVKAALDALPAAGPSDDRDVTRWPLDRLADHIVNTHHAYVRAALPAIARHLAKIVEVHGARHPELPRIETAFTQIARDLLQHMLKEERVLFPYIRQLARHNSEMRMPSPFGTVENPIRMMEREHRQAGDEMHLIRALTNGFVPPSTACATYRVTFDELALFERNLHRHVHLENNVLFPRAVDLEQRTCRA